MYIEELGKAKEAPFFSTICLISMANLSLTDNHSFHLFVFVKHRIYISIELSENLSTLTATPIVGS